ncbi:hypothetical protein CPAST_c01680 [Clostridium pasteurianum DSM 525 = ATCC 6013]|uniref:DUF4190 domain-containing protein n=1 Tax=Clostridium pasteurianum DSM 525 = ATCC 6013 TaxID=1262449 RepID=A0A0H3J2X6_CLOPA|nr:hypothetical protein [Clostridium pasteurianum]AJA46268.1 hypothetical protein CPAST_c01680 [Clostridium pasteurianum DSM 525 = ATCC 6013]AJA50256.1 hypothetical protein CLPA_c01680 [Clostridium pasteurianum DSM 525 = ATCC 6013]AOZ73720.1 hypothetical protein AQ983_00825 [Clostridium pasteurianum DSM 525 = ATCC 6013]AOZ77517.1 hypothetical protein AQ984_00825 [Clostridium pasteurianum]ELP60852.1 hypothetical protein F502_00285 [Clostridium pasteurianum DSM 525 = ATCC 6013]
MKNNDMAIATLILGIVGLILCFIPIINFIGLLFSILGIIIGIKTKIRFQEYDITLKGDSLATSGIVLSIMGIIVFIIVITIMGVFTASL